MRRGGRGRGGGGRGGGRGWGGGGGDKMRTAEFSAKLYPERGTPVLEHKSAGAANSRYLVQQYQNFIIELQSSAFFVGDHQNDEIQRYSDRASNSRPTTNLGKELAALPAWVPEGERQQYMPRDILLWLENKQGSSLFSSKTDLTSAESTEYGQMMLEWREQEREMDSDSEEESSESESADGEQRGGAGKGDDDGSDDDNEYNKARGESDDSASDDGDGPVF